MSKENIAKFYERLESDMLLRAKALSLKDIYPEQEQLIDAFIALAAEQGFTFTFEEFMQYMYEKAQ